jgi:hypothetical protein
MAVQGRLNSPQQQKAGIQRILDLLTPCERMHQFINRKT